MTDIEGPNVIILRKEVYDPSKEEYVKEILPTVSVKKAFRDTGTMSAGELIGSHYIGAGSVLRVTRMRVYTDAANEFIVADRNGTLDIIPFETSGGETLLSGPNEPIYITEGTIRIRALGSVSAGTRVVAFEGIAISRIPLK